MHTGFWSGTVGEKTA